MLCGVGVGGAVQASNVMDTLNQGMMYDLYNPIDNTIGQWYIQMRHTGE